MLQGYVLFLKNFTTSIYRNFVRFFKLRNVMSQKKEKFVITCCTLLEGGYEKFFKISWDFIP